MSRFTVRSLTSDEFAALDGLETEVFGAHVIDFYGPGDERIVSTIDRPTIDRMRGKYERLGFLPKRLEAA